LDPFQYDPKKDLACMGDKSNCSAICTLLKIAFLGKWDERGERPFLCDTVNEFKSYLKKHWQYQDTVYDYKAEIHATGSQSLH